MGCAGGGAQRRVGRWCLGCAGCVYDDGVGFGKGQTVNPVALAFDSFLTRLVVVEAFGRLQIFDARSATELGANAQRYITQWGSAGINQSEFAFFPATAAAVAVDSRGRIFVADKPDAPGRIQVFAP